MLINNETIIKDNDPLMRSKSKVVKLPLSKEDRDILLDMLKYVEESINPELAESKNLRPAVGISAIQIGIPKRMTAIRFYDVDKNGDEILHEYCLVNPKIVSRSTQKAYLENGEGCLSVVEDHKGHVVRNARITVEGYDFLRDEYITIRARGYLAIVLQHELDHFEGILFYDYIDKNDPFKEVENALVI